MVLGGNQYGFGFLTLRGTIRGWQYGVQSGGFCDQASTVCTILKSKARFIGFGGDRCVWKSVQFPGFGPVGTRLADGKLGRRVLRVVLLDFEIKHFG